MKSRVGRASVGLKCELLGFYRPVRVMYGVGYVRAGVYEYRYVRGVCVCMYGVVAGSDFWFAPLSVRRLFRAASSPYQART